MHIGLPYSHSKYGLCKGLSSQELKKRPRCSNPDSDHRAGFQFDVLPNEVLGIRISQHSTLHTCGYSVPLVMEVKHK